MPNPNYVKGRAKEYKVVNREKARGCLAFRSAGSHSPIDVVSIDAHYRVIRLIQCKPDTMSEKAKSKLYAAHINLDGMYEVEFLVE